MSGVWIIVGKNLVRLNSYRFSIKRMVTCHTIQNHRKRSKLTVMNGARITYALTSCSQVLHAS